MDPIRWLIFSGVVLLSIAALLGFVQERHRDRATFAAWRVVHAGGTAGAVQLLALAAVWERLAGSGPRSIALALALIAVAWAFFLGPLAKVLGYSRVARTLNIAGAVLAVPTYLALPIAVW